MIYSKSSSRIYLVEFTALAIWFILFAMPVICFINSLISCVGCSFILYPLIQLFKNSDSVKPAYLNFTFNKSSTFWFT